MADTVQATPQTRSRIDSDLQRTYATVEHSSTTQPSCFPKTGLSRRYRTQPGTSLEPITRHLDKIFTRRGPTVPSGWVAVASKGGERCKQMVKCIMYVVHIYCAYPAYPISRFIGTPHPANEGLRGPSPFQHTVPSVPTIRLTYPGNPLTLAQVMTSQSRVTLPYLFSHPPMKRMGQSKHQIEVVRTPGA
ncbi:Hypothetical predicted protein [Pelobates cultripes]|uniref:Uncharacterized protein n=1 Tax=Pelobates cultripes TaxID=61616 RepID=A0AAD1WBC6_PELCU|nr:Hypothetical predicted protein [Pelobates cultripes]